MREPPTYRLELEEILKATNGGHVLDIQQVMAYTGKSRNWCMAHLEISKDGISASKLAYQLATI